MFGSNRQRSQKKHAPAKRPHGIRLSGFENLEDRRMLAIIAVTTTLDEFEPSVVTLAHRFGTDGKLSLREAVYLANINPGPDTISLPTGTYKITRVGTGEDADATGDFDILDTTTIAAAKNAKPIIDGNAMDRVFDVPTTSSATSVEFDGVVIQKGSTASTGGGGAGIDIGKPGVSLTLVDSTITNNLATGMGGSGGGIFSATGNITLLRSHVDGNTAGENGGGIDLRGGLGVITLTSSTVNGNTAGLVGGGIEDSATSAFTATGSQINNNHANGGDGGGADLGAHSVTIDSTTVNNNTTTRHGGGINIQFGVEGVVTIRNKSTFSGNSAADIGGGLNGEGAISVLNSCFIQNIAVNGGGGINEDDPGNITVVGSTFTKNVALLEVGGGIWAAGSSDLITITDSQFTYNSGNDSGGNDGGGAINAAGDQVKVVGSTFDHNTSSTSGGAIGGVGTAITVADDSYSKSYFTNNRANGGDGGGLDAHGADVTVTGTVFSGNLATGDGGGFSANQAMNGGSVSVTNSTLCNNSAGNNGGAFTADGTTLRLYGSTLNNNAASNNGGGAYVTTSGINPPGATPLLFTPGSLIANSTIGANGTAGNGGGVYFNGSGDLNIYNATIVYNTALHGGGVFSATAFKVHVGNTIIALNTAPTGPDVSGTFLDNDYNLVFDNTDSGSSFSGTHNILGMDPKLGPLANNGGPTQTYALLAGSPAIDKALDSQAPLTDQRGVTRPQGSHADIGAYEYQAPAPKKGGGGGWGWW